MGKKAQRAFTLFLALLFFATSVGFSGYVIWQILKDNDKNPPAASEQTPPPNQETKEGQLQGTKLEGFTPLAKIDELKAIDLVPGSGPEAKSTDTVTIHYTGALAKDGTIFQSSHDTGEPFTSPLSSLIAGWQKGVPGMKVGGKRRLLIPAAQAYGDREQSGIPANSDLVFDIELVSLP